MLRVLFLGLMLIPHASFIAVADDKPASQANSYYENSPFKIPVFKNEKKEFDLDDLYRDAYSESKRQDQKPELKPQKNEVIKPKKVSVTSTEEKLKTINVTNKPQNKEQQEILEETLDKIIPAIFDKPNNKAKVKIDNPKSVPRSLRENYGKEIVKKEDCFKEDKISANLVCEDDIDKFFDKYSYEKKSPKNEVLKSISKNFEEKNVYFKPSLVTRKIPVIVLDPGHGGKDPGAIGKLKTREKDVVLSYSIALKRLLEAKGRYKVVMTRYGDKYVKLHDRVKIARRAKGDIMISIHADSHPNPNTKGFSVYTISRSRASREAKKLLRQADYKEVITGVELKGEASDVKEAIIDFAQKETKDISDEFSKILAKKLGQKVKPLRRTNREGSLAVLTGADIPSVLLELGYLSNRSEEKLLRNKDHQRKIVTSIKAAIDDYFNKYSFMIEEQR